MSPCNSYPCPLRSEVVGCDKLRVSSDLVGASFVEDDAGHMAYLQQRDLRLQPGCASEEWAGRCPALSTMLLAVKKGGCLAVGCFGVAGDTQPSALVLEVSKENEKPRRAGDR